MGECLSYKHEDMYVVPRTWVKIYQAWRTVFAIPALGVTGCCLGLTGCHPSQIHNFRFGERSC